MKLKVICNNDYSLKINRNNNYTLNATNNEYGLNINIPTAYSLFAKSNVYYLNVKGTIRLMEPLATQSNELIETQDSKLIYVLG